MNSDENGYKIWLHNIKDKDCWEGNVKKFDYKNY